MKKVLIVGVTSGIGLALAELMMKSGYLVIGAGRNIDALNKIQLQNQDTFIPLQLDVCQPETIETILQNGIEKAGGLDICVISSGVSIRNPLLDWEVEEKVISTNVVGFSQVAIFAANYFKKQKSGHIVGISSIAKYFGNPNPAYNATKAFEATYLDGLRMRLERNNINVTTVLPGFVETPMTEDQPRRFWSAEPEKAAKQFLKAIEKKKRFVFITKRWRLFSWILPLMPYTLVSKIMRK